MKRKLLIGVAILISLIFSMLIGSQIMVRFFEKSSEKLIIEYHELYSLQEYKLTMNELLILSDEINNKGHLDQKNDFLKSLNTLTEKYNTSKEVLTKEHEGSLLEELDDITNSISQTGIKLLDSKTSDDFYINQTTQKQITLGVKKVDMLIGETKEEIEEYERKIRTVTLHGTITVLTFGILLILILSIGGFAFVKSLTKPIQELVLATEIISSGDRKSRVSVSSNDEFKLLANSFNSMLDALDQSTVSEEYFKNIVNSLFGALIVIDNDMRIKYVNAITINLLEYQESELLGKSIMILFENKYVLKNDLLASKEQLSLVREFFNEQKYMVTKNGELIPVLVTSTLLNDNKGNPEALVVVGHDLTEKIQYEKQLERNRKENLIAINEAQEEERMRIAIDIHDGLGQLLTGISYTLQEINEGSDFDELKNIQNQIDLAIQETRSLAHNLIPLVLVEFGLISAIQNLVEEANKASNTRFYFNYYDINERIDPKLEKNIYRICQEAITNILKHAEAKMANIQLLKNKDQLTLVIEDDGKGFDQRNINLDKMDKSGGIGLISIRERITSYDGNFTIDSQKGEGTELIIELSCQKMKL
mgnify:CR=1 FL=1